jgi:hypothetical protein
MTHEVATAGPGDVGAVVGGGEELQHERESAAINALVTPVGKGSLSNVVWNVRNQYLAHPGCHIEAETVQWSVEGFLAEIATLKTSVIPEAVTYLQEYSGYLWKRGATERSIKVGQAAAQLAGHAAPPTYGNSGTGEGSCG